MTQTQTLPSPLSPEGLSLLRRWCKAFDTEYGHWPVHKFEGWAVYNWIEARGDATRLSTQPYGWVEKEPAL